MRPTRSIVPALALLTAGCIVVTEPEPVVRTDTPPAKPPLVVEEDDPPPPPQPKPGYLRVSIVSPAPQARRTKLPVEVLFDVVHQRPLAVAKVNGEQADLVWSKPARAARPVRPARSPYAGRPFVLVAARRWYSGAGLKRRESQAVRQGVWSSCRDSLQRGKLRLAKGGDDFFGKVDRASVQLGPIPGTVKLQRCADYFGARLLVLLRGELAFRRFPPGSPQRRTHKGSLRCRGVRVLVYDRDSDTVLARFTVQSQASKRTATEATPGALHQPWVGRSQSVAAASAAYAKVVGRMIGRGIKRRLAGRARPAPGPRLTRSRYRATLPEAKTGLNALRAMAKDRAGTFARASSSFRFLPPDRIKPSIQILAPVEGAVLEQAPVVIKVKVRDNRRVARVAINGAVVRGNALGIYQARMPRPNAGVNAVRVDAWDAAGNQGSATLRFTFRRPDVTPPTVRVLAPAAGRVLTTRPIHVVVAARDDQGVTRVKINGKQARRDRKGRWRVTLTRPLTGVNKVVVVAWDAAGNKGIARASFTYDDKPPSVVAKARILVEGKVDDLSCTLTINGRTVKYDKRTGRYSVRVPADPKQPNKVTIVAVDEFGNKSVETRVVR